VGRGRGQVWMNRKQIKKSIQRGVYKGQHRDNTRRSKKNFFSFLFASLLFSSLLFSSVLFSSLLFSSQRFFSSCASFFHFFIFSSFSLFFLFCLNAFRLTFLFSFLLPYLPEMTLLLLLLRACQVVIHLQMHLL